MSLKPIPIYRRIFWLLILIASAVCTYRMLLQVLSLYSGGAVSYFVETDYLEFETPFPAVTLCEQSSTSNDDKYKKYLHDHGIPVNRIRFFKDVLFWNPKFCKTCNQCKLEKNCEEDFIEHVKNVRVRCTDMLTDCWWGDKPFKCCDRFLPLASEYGTCFSFNSRLTGNDSTLIVSRKHGLPSLTFTAIEDVGIRAHSPDDMVSAGMENILGRPVVLPLITDFELILKVEQTVSDKSVATMPPAVRKCLFKDERPDFAQFWPSNRYSYSTCVLYCRAVNQMQLCNCTHHLMPRMGNFPPCDIEGLTCLFHNKDLIGTNSCDCPMSCEEINYKLVHMFSVRHIDNLTPDLVKRGTRALVRLIQLPSSRIRRTVIRDIMGVVVDVGGIGGVFFGASLLSIIEIVYLCCMRKKR